MNKKFITLLALPLVIGALAGCGGKKSYACDKLDFDDSLVVENPMTGEERAAFVTEVLENTYALASGAKGESSMLYHDEEMWIEGHMELDGKIYNNEAAKTVQKARDLRTRLGSKATLSYTELEFNHGGHGYELESYTGSWHGEKFVTSWSDEDDEHDNFARKVIDNNDLVSRFRENADIEKNGEDYLAVLNNNSSWTNSYYGQEYPYSRKRQMVFEIGKVNNKDVLTGYTLVEEEYSGLDPVTHEIDANPVHLVSSEKWLLEVEFGKDHGNLSDKEKQEVFDALENAPLFNPYVRGRHYFANEDGTISSSSDHSSYFTFPNFLSRNKVKVFGTIDLNENYEKDEYIKIIAEAETNDDDVECEFTNSLSDVLKKLPKGLEFVTVDSVDYLHVKNEEFEYGKQIFVVFTMEKVGDSYKLTFDKAVYEDYDPFSLGS